MQVAGLQTQTDQSPQSKTLISAGWQANTVQSLKGWSTHSLKEETQWNRDNTATDIKEATTVEQKKVF